MEQQPPVKIFTYYQKEEEEEEEEGLAGVKHLEKSEQQE